MAYEGSLIQVDNTQSIVQCQRNCNDNSNCQFWSFDNINDACKLWESVSNKVVSDKTYSGRESCIVQPGIMLMKITILDFICMIHIFSNV